jgi:urea transporter
MAAVAHSLRRGALGAFQRATTDAAHSVFSQQRWVGVAILAALAVRPQCLLLGLCALAAAELTVRGLRVQNAYVPYGYNALLCGIAIAHEYAVSAEACGFAAALGAGSVLVSAALAALSASVGYLPVLSIPFALVSWFAVGVAPRLPLMAADRGLDSWAASLPPFAALALQSLGTFVLLPDVRAGALVLCALLLYSRIAAVLATGAVVFLLALLQLAHAPLSDSALQLIASNAGLSAVAIGGVWLIPSGSASLVAFGAALLSAFFALGLATPLARLGLPLTFVPFQLAVLSTLSALRLRATASLPRLAQIPAETPEQLATNDLHETDAAVFRLPFDGTWCCTQGVDGAYTHRGVLRHAYDFELPGFDGALCAGSGQRPEDYHCFGKPVLAAASGTVVAIENSVPNNAVGEDNCQSPWGNYVIVQHAPSLHSVVAHLSPGTVVVYPGQFVWRGQVLGYCGSSGRAPRPHVHFQVQASAALGSPTQPSRFSNVLVRSAGPTRFELAHTPRQGDALQSLRPDYALAAPFQFPLGLTLTYDVAGRRERIVCDVDAWGRSVLRSLDRRAELVIVRTESYFSCTELRGAHDSVLRLLRLALGCVPFERHPELTLRSAVPLRWLGGFWRRLRSDLQTLLIGAPRIELQSEFAIEARGIAIVGRSLEPHAGVAPNVQTRALFGTAPGPAVLEVEAFGRMERAELVVDGPARRSLPAESDARAVSGLAIGAGGWS